MNRMILCIGCCVCILLADCAGRNAATTVPQVYGVYENFSFPVIPLHGKSVSAFTPAGWTADDTLCEDLNRDGMQDVLLLLSYPDTIDQYEYPEGSMNYQVFEQRILLLLYKKGKGYVQNTYCYKLLNLNGGMGRGGLPLQPAPGMLTVVFETVSSGMYYGYYTFEPEAGSGRWALTQVETGGGGANHSMHSSYNFKNDSLHIHSSHWEYNEALDSLISESQQDFETVIPSDSVYYLDRMDFMEDGMYTPDYVLPQAPEEK